MIKRYLRQVDVSRKPGSRGQTYSLPFTDLVQCICAPEKSRKESASTSWLIWEMPVCAAAEFIGRLHNNSRPGHGPQCLNRVLSSEKYHLHIHNNQNVRHTLKSFPMNVRFGPIKHKVQLGLHPVMAPYIGIGFIRPEYSKAGILSPDERIISAHNSDWAC